MIDDHPPTPWSRTSKSTRLAVPTALCILVLGSAVIATGCGETTRGTTSPVVSADSEEGKKALAQDEAERQLRKQKEAKAAARHKKITLPDEG